MNTFQLTCFLTLVETLSFVKAAKQLNVTQPAITHQIRSLEDELNTQLFKRTTRSVEITQEGLIFLNDRPARRPQGKPLRRAEGRLPLHQRHGGADTQRQRSERAVSAPGTLHRLLPPQLLCGGQGKAGGHSRQVRGRHPAPVHPQGEPDGSGRAEKPDCH